MDLDVFGRDVSWTTEDKVQLWQKLTKLHDRGLTVEHHEQMLEEWFFHENIQKLHEDLIEKRQELFRIWRTGDLRHHSVLKRLPPKMQHIEHRELEFIVRMMKAAVLDLKYHKNLVQSRTIQLEKSLPGLEMELKRLEGFKDKNPKMNAMERRFYVEFQDASTIFKAAQYVNASYKKIIDFLLEDTLKSKLELQHVQQDQKMLKSLTTEAEIFHRKCLGRLAFFSGQFQHRYRELQLNLESHLQRYFEMEEQHEEMQRKMEQEIESGQKQPLAQRESHETIGDLKIRVEEVEQKIRSLQSATRCLELGGIEARVKRQLPDAEQFMADAERLREARVSLIEKRKEIELQHDRYLQTTEQEFRTRDQKISDLKLMIDSQRDRQVKYCREIQERSQQRIQLIISLEALKFSLRNIKPTPEDQEQAPDWSIFGNRHDLELKNHEEALKILNDTHNRCEILVNKYDFNLPKDQVADYEHCQQDRVLQKISPRQDFKKLTSILQEAEKNFAQTLDNVSLDTSDVPTRKDIKRMSRLIVSMNKMGKD